MLHTTSPFILPQLPSKPNQLYINSTNGLNTSFPGFASLKWVEPHEMDKLTLIELAELQLIPNAHKFRLMLCETFVSTGSCPFHSENRNLCAFAHDKRICTKESLQSRSLTSSSLPHLSNPNKLVKNSIGLDQNAKQKTIITPIHWPNRQKLAQPNTKLAKISSYITYNEPDITRSFKRSLCKRCVFYIWDSFLINLNDIQNLGEVAHVFQEQHDFDSHFVSRNVRKDNRSYYTRRLSVFVNIKQSDNSHCINDNLLKPYFDN